MKVLFDLRAGKISIEGDGPDLIDVLKAARELSPNVSQIQIVTDADLVSGPESPSPRQSSAASETGVSRQTMRQFARSLALENSAERIAAVGYYANRIEGRASFSPKEVDGWFTMCGFPKPSQMSVAMYDAKRKYGYVDNPHRGAWRVSNQGENLIVRKIEESGETE
jgi:hypothetical protein